LQEKCAEEKKNPLKIRNIRLTIINALNLISYFKFIQIFLIFISINRLTCKEKSAEGKKNPIKKRNVRLAIINALNLISCFKFIQIFYYIHFNKQIHA